MADERFTWLHLPLGTSLDEAADDTDFWGVHLVEERFDESVWDLLPPYQDEEDESMLPSAAHPSYPYGNPYAPSTSRRSQWHSATPNADHRPGHLPYRGGFPLPPLASSSSSLAPRGFSSLGSGFSTGPRTSAWTDLALSSLLPPTGLGRGQTEEDEMGAEGGPTGQEQQQDAPQTAAADGANGAPTTGGGGAGGQPGGGGQGGGGTGEAAQWLDTPASPSASPPMSEVDQNESGEL